MKRLRIMKSYAILWLFIYFLIYSNIATIKVFFFATLTFNLAVLTMLTIGIIMLMKASTNLVMLAGTFGTLAYKKDNLSFYLKGIENIMPANIAHMFHSRAEKGVMLFTSEESRDVIEWIEDKFFNQNRYTNYFIGTVLMIGLLGTFTGLLIAIDDMGRIIMSLSGDIDLAKVIADFSGPLGGMAVGFGSSLFGVVAAIILGIKGYILNKNQEILIEGVEDWLKGRIINVNSTGPATIGADGTQLPEHQNSFIDVFIDQISSMTQEMAKITQSNERLHSITIASVQQARNEHELSIDIMESMSQSLQSIDTHSQQTSKMLNEQFSALSKNIHSDQEGAVESYKQSINTLFERLESALNSAQHTISNEFAKMTQESADMTAGHVNKINSALANIDVHLEHEKHTLERLLENSTHANLTHENQLKEIAKLLQHSSQTLSQEQQQLTTLHEQLSLNDKNSSSHMNKIISSISKVGETLELEVQQLGNMEDKQKLHNASLEKNLELLSQMKQTLESTQDNNSQALNELQGIKTEITSMNTEVNENSRTQLTKVSQEIQSLRQLMKEGQEQQSDILLTQSAQNEISDKGNAILTEILNDQKMQMKTLLSQQENMLLEQKNLSTLSQEGLNQGNDNLIKLQEQAATALKEQEGFREEHRMLLTLTQRSSDLSEEAAGMNLDKSSDSLEAIERLILENQQIKQEIQNLTDVIRKKSFGSSDGGDGFISKLFK